MPSFDQSSSSATPAWAQTDSHDEMDTTGEDDQDNVFRDMTFDEIMEELIARFMVNLPREETTLVRLYWQAEQAHWFYEDYLRPINPFLPSLSQKHFANLIIASSPIYANLINAGGAKIDYDAVWIDYMEYKRMVPTCGVILVNRQGTKVILVRGWKSSAGWSFPRGKINEKESEEACAIRELEEETGFDCSRMLNPKAKYQTYVNAQSVTMFFVTGVDENTKFAPKTRMEIGGIEWVKLKDLPTWNRKRTKTSPKGSKKFYNVTPFVVPLKRYLKDNGILDSGKADTSEYIPNPRLPLSGHDDSQFGHISPPSTLPPVSSHPITKPATTLDQLFAKFVNKQEEDLQTGGITVGGDNKAGLERLFGNMTVAEEEKQQQQQDGEASGSEDDALSRLLGAIGPSATPAPMKQQAPPPTSGKGGRLLAVLNQKASPSSQPAPSPTPPSVPEPMVSRYPQQPVAKPHQASLLAVLSSQGQSNSSTPSSDTTIHGKPMSLPTSPRPASPAEAERKNKQRALLEMTIAGIGLDSNAPRGNEGTSYGQGHGSGHHDYQPQHTTPPVHGSYGTNSVDPPRVTPPQTYGQQYRPPAPQQPQSYAPPPGTYYSNNQQHQPQQQQQQGPQGQQNHGGGGPSPGRTRGAPPPYESHYAGQSGPSRPPPPPHAVPVQPPHTIDYSHHPQPQGMYQPRPPQPGPGVGQGYRLHQPINQPYIPSGFQQHPPPLQLQQPFVAPQQHQQQQQQPFISPSQQHPPAQYYNNNQGGPGLANYQAPPPRPMPMPMPMASHQYQPPSMPPPPPQGQYAGTGHGQPYNPVPNSNVNAGAPGHTGQMHQPIPKNGPQTGMLLAMLNDTRGR